MRVLLIAERPFYYALCGLMLFRLTNSRLARPVRLARAEAPDLEEPDQGLRLVDSREKGQPQCNRRLRGSWRTQRLPIIASGL